jgi:hypothetical protein
MKAADPKDLTAKRFIEKLKTCQSDDELRKIQRREHRLATAREDDFSIRNNADFLNTLGQTTQIFTTARGDCGGEPARRRHRIMNIMLVPVTERTRKSGSAMLALPGRTPTQFWTRRWCRPPGRS